MNVVKDLGMYVDERLEFSGLVRIIVARAFHTAKHVLKCLNSKDTKVMARALFEV